MALDTGNYISDLSRLNPTATDPVSEGDDVLRFVKKVIAFGGGDMEVASLLLEGGDLTHRFFGSQKLTLLLTH